MGFFGTDAPVVVDLFLLVLLLVVPAMALAIGLVRRGKVKAHATVMTVCFVAFTLAVAAFEFRVHFGDPGPPLDKTVLAIHLAFALPCLGLWIYQIARARRVQTEAAAHRRRGRWLFGILVGTVATGIWLYLNTYG